MAANRATSKKRKAAEDLDAERTLFGAFQQAAASVTSLYTLAAQQQRKSQDAGAKQALDRVASWVFSQYAGSAVVPTAALLEFLRAEMQECAGDDTGDFQVSFPPPTALPVPPSYGENSGDENMLGDQSGLRRGCGGMQVSPPKRSSSQSLHHHQLYLQHAQAQQQQQQQQQQQGFFPGV